MKLEVDLLSPEVYKAYERYLQYRSKEEPFFTFAGWLHDRRPMAKKDPDFAALNNAWKNP